MQHKFLASSGFEPMFFEIHNLISNLAQILDFARKKESLVGFTYKQRKVRICINLNVGVVKVGFDVKVIHCKDTFSSFFHLKCLKTDQLARKNRLNTNLTIKRKFSYFKTLEYFC